MFTSRCALLSGLYGNIKPHINTKYAVAGIGLCATAGFAAWWYTNNKVIVQPSKENLPRVFSPTTIYEAIPEMGEEYGIRYPNRQEVDAHTHWYPEDLIPGFVKNDNTPELVITLRELAQEYQKAQDPIVTDGTYQFKICPDPKGKIINPVVLIAQQCTNFKTSPHCGRTMYSGDELDRLLQLQKIQSSKERFVGYEHGSLSYKRLPANIQAIKYFEDSAKEILETQRTKN